MLTRGHWPAIVSIKVRELVSQQRAGAGNTAFLREWQEILVPPRPLNPKSLIPGYQSLL